MIELQPIHDTHKSFYKKAHTLTEDNKTYLVSYNTTVAQVIDGELSINGTYSSTTLRHIKEFIHQMGFEVGSKDEIAKMYLK